MKRIQICMAFGAAFALAVPSLSADVKTKERTTFALEGMLGGMMRLFGGGAAKDGIESTIAVRGNRKSTINSTTGRIVDLGEQKSYALDVRRREYTVSTFAELKAQFEKAQADAKKQMEGMSAEDKAQMQEANKQLEFEAKVNETGQRKSIAGHDTREVVLTITGREKGKTLEESGGFVLTNTMWLAPRIAALDESVQFELAAAKAIYGESFSGDMQQMAPMVAMYPAFSEMARQMQGEGRRLQGTSLSTSMTFESVRGAAQMKAAADQQASSGGGGLAGRLGGRLLGRGREPQARAKILTSTRDVLSIETTVSDADVAMPAGYRERK